MERRVVWIKDISRGVADPRVEPPDETVHTVFRAPVSSTSVQADPPSPLHVREPSKAVVRCDHPRVVKRERRRHTHQKTLPSSHAQPVFRAPYAVKSDAYSKMAPSSRPHPPIMYLQRALGCVRDVPQLFVREPEGSRHEPRPYVWAPLGGSLDPRASSAACDADTEAVATPVTTTDPSLSSATIG